MEDTDRVYLRNMTCGLCNDLRRRLEDAIQEEDRLIRALVVERRCHERKEKVPQGEETSLG